MDFHSLVACHLTPTRRPAAMDAEAETRYYRAAANLPKPPLGALVSLATAAGVFLLLAGFAQA